jgi:hypothetical protein
MTLLPFILPAGFVPKVAEDHKVKEGDVLAENSTPSEVAINIAEDLGIPIRKVRNVLRKNTGDLVEEGDILAEKKGLMGGKIIKSTISGIVARIDEEKGSIIIKSKTDSGVDRILSPVDGTVTMVGEGKILLKTDREALVADKSSGNTYLGNVEKLKKTDLRDIDVSIAGKIIVVGEIGREVLAKVLGLGVGAVVASEIADSEFDNLTSKDIKTPVLRVKEKDLDVFLKNVHKILVDGEKGVIVKV